ncbi:DNA cytosine methyltransferase [Plantibacter flavus]|uniref:DNA cytosine methyltransferase n=1 Tax=Plantibacter flavus TaxID=150123 RepID=UPI003F14FD11
MDNVTSIDAAKPKVLEFFAGIGLARIGLEAAGFKVTWSNDYEADKRSMYQTHFRDPQGSHEFRLGDIGTVSVDELPQDAALAWASSPCTDLSLAGGRAGLAGSESGTFWEYIRLLGELKDRGVLPPVAVLENVVGLATSHGGDDLVAAITAFNDLGYSVDVLAIDARRFVAQSRPRLFLIAVVDPRDDPEGISELRPDWLQWVFDDTKLRTHRTSLPSAPAVKLSGFGDLTERMAHDDERWWDTDRTARFVNSLSPMQLARVTEMQLAEGIRFRTAYRRTRNGIAVWEVRPDDVSGCLRTARGGSSKQAVVCLGDGQLKVRWMTPREYARLMGADEYVLDGARTNQALFGFGDAVAVPAVSWLARNYLIRAVRGEFANVAVGTEIAHG